MAFDIAAERFDVAYDAGRTSPEAIVAVVRALGFEPTLVAAAPPGEAGPSSVDVAALPESLRALFAEAREAGRGVLLDFTAPG